ncbi:MAG: 3,4-dihydroxy-2-butanone-4-phosphate synthase [Deltaproteobacteria bacterium]|nr:3,4-dihydroxy-2-butanone-4-phosphate synthase [Deltaproteobacteria bacterium]
MTGDSLSRVERAIDEIRRGRMVILMDDSDRENEGDLTLAAELVTPEAIAFMAMHGRGLICLSLTEERVNQLDLPMMARRNRSRYGTNFTVSVEAARGVTTGISAADRATTVLAAVAPEARSEDLVTPGHIFPLRAAPGGVLERVGQTEGSVDLARLAGLTPAGVICEVMKDDGTMARLDDLEALAEQHDLVLLDIADVIEFRIKRELLVERVNEQEVTISVDGKNVPFRQYLYQSRIKEHPQEFLALVHGKVSTQPTLCRVHQGHLLLDQFGIQGARGRVTAEESLSLIVREGAGVLLYLPPRETLARELESGGEEQEAGDDASAQHVLRRFGMGAQVLLHIGLKRIRLVTRSRRKIVGLEGFNLEIVEYVAP